MTLLERALLDKLIELEKAVEEMRQTRTKADLLPYFSTIETLSHQLPRGTDPSLLHYLYKRSYQKARVLLEESQSSNG